MIKTLTLCLTLLMGTLSQDAIVSAGNLGVNSLATYTFDIILPSPFLAAPGSAITITFPTQYQGSVTNGVYSCSTTSWDNSSAITCAVNGLVLTVSNGFPNLYNGDVNNFIEFVVSNIKNPPYSGTTSDFSGNFVNGSGGTTAMSLGGSGLSITPGVLSCSFLASGTTVVGSQSVLLAQITPQNPISSGGSLRITS